jgi:hypothetical protein
MSDEKYTAGEWAAMSGGHSVEKKSSKLQLVNELTESRLFRNKKIASDVNLDDAAELAFVQLMMLNVFNKDYDFAPLAREYASRTMAFRNFDSFRTSGTDLYIALNRVMGKDQKYDTNKDKIAASRIKPSRGDVIRYLDHVSNSKTDASFEKRMLLRFEKQFNIQDSLLKSMRRLVGDWDNLNQNQKALVVTRMSQYMRKKAMRSELTPALLKFQKRGNYIVSDKGDTKKKIWDKPIVRAAAAVGAIYGAGKLGKYLGKSTYQTDRNLGKRYPKTGSTK